jgi:hypothetical protein
MPYSSAHEAGSEAMFSAKKSCDGFLEGIRSLVGESPSAS